MIKITNKRKRIKYLYPLLLIFILLPFSNVTAANVNAWADTSPRGGCVSSYTAKTGGRGSASNIWGPITQEGITLEGTYRGTAVNYIDRTVNVYKTNGSMITSPYLEARVYYSIRGKYAGSGFNDHRFWSDGGSAQRGYTSGVMVDGLAPSSCSSSISGLSNGWAGRGSNLRITFTPTDAGCAGANPFTVNVSNPTAGHYNSGASDNLNNYSHMNLCSATWNVDTTAPSCYSNQDPTYWTAGSVKVWASGSDGQSGFRSGTSTYATNENQTVSVTCYDNVGNSKVVSRTVTNIDKTAPSCGNVSFPRPGNGQYVKTSIPVTVGCSDPQLNGGSGEGSGCTAGSYTEQISGGYGQIGMQDKVGHYSSCPVSYDFWDGDGPSVNISFAAPHQDNSSTKYTRDEKIHVIVTSNDNKAGVDRVCYSLSGATNQGEKCVSGNKAEFDISNEGITNITAWAFDKALDYNNGYFYNGGNRSGNVTKSAYIDRTIPTFSVKTTYDDLLNASENERWTNQLIISTVTGTDLTNASNNDKSYSGIGSIEVYYGITDDPTEVWENIDKRCSEGNVSALDNMWCSANVLNISDKTRADKIYYPSSPKLPKITYNTPQLDSLKVLTSYSNNVNQTYTSSLTMPDSLALNDEIYAHIRVCDNAYSGKGSSSSYKAPHCVTGVYGPMYFDNIPPDLDKDPDDNGNSNNDKNPDDDIIAILPPDIIKPANPSTDPDNPTTDPSNPSGGNGSEIIDPEDLPGDKQPDKNGGDDNNDGVPDYREYSTLDNHDWTNKLIIGFKAQEAQAMKEDGSGYRLNSGLDRLEFYYDTNYVHEDNIKYNPRNSSYPSQYNNVRMDCSDDTNKNAQSCAYLLDFNSLSDYIGGQQINHSVMEEGSRFIKVNAVDLAGNVKTVYFGPYKFDITPNELSQFEFNGPDGTFIEK